MEKSRRENHRKLYDPYHPSNTLLTDIHDRMPVIVTPDNTTLVESEIEDFDAVREILKPYDRA